MVQLFFNVVSLACPVTPIIIFVWVYQNKYDQVVTIRKNYNLKNT